MSLDPNFSSVDFSQARLLDPSSLDDSSIEVNPALMERASGVIKNLGNQFKEEFLSLSHCPLSQEEIRERSVLHSFPLDPMPCKANFIKSQEERALSVLANFAGDGLVTGGANALDGMNPEENFYIWKWLLENIEKMVEEDSEERVFLGKLIDDVEELKVFSGQINSLVKDVGNEERLREIAEHYTECVQQLEEGQSYVFSGGWGGTPGHSMVYEFFRNEKGLYDLNMYNSTGFQLADTFDSGDKEKVSPVIRYSDIPEERLFFNGDGVCRVEFIQHMIEIQMIAFWGENQPFGKEDVLEWLDHLENYRVFLDLEQQGAITGQRAGSCTPASTKKWIRARYKSKERFKRFKTEATIRLIIGAYRILEKTIEEDSSIGAQARHVLEQVARNQVRDLNKNITGFHGEGVQLDEEVAFAFQATLYDILQNVAAKKREIEDIRHETMVSSDVHTFDTFDQRDVRLNFRERFLPNHIGYEVEEAQLKEVPIIDVQVVFVDEESGDIQVDFSLLQERIFNLTEYAEREHSDKKVLNLAIHQLAKQLPLPILNLEMSDLGVILAEGACPCLDEYSSEQRLALVESLALLLETYQKSVKKDLITRAFATTLPLYVLIHYLSIKAQMERFGDDPNLQILLCNVLTPWNFLNNIEGLAYYDYGDYKKIEASIQYFNQLSRFSKRSPIFGEEGSVEVNRFEVKRPKSHNKPEEILLNGLFWEALLAQDPDLRASLEEKGNERWPDLTEEEIEACFQEELREYYEQVQENTRCKYPKRCVNLALDTKCVMLLEEMLDSKDDKILKERGYGHIVYLRRASFFSQRLISSYYSPVLNVSAKRESEYGQQGFVSKPSAKVEDDFYRTSNAYLESLYRRFNGSHKAFFQKSEVCRWDDQIENSIAEGEVVKNTRKIPSFLEKLQRTGSEATLTPYQLIMEFSQDLDTLDDPSMQALFFRLFFRSMVESRRTFAELGAGQLLLEDEALRESCASFINKGLNYFYQTRYENGIEGARFFLEFSFYVSKYLYDGGKKECLQAFDVVPTIDGWLAEEENLPEQTFSILHRYRFLHNSLTFFDKAFEEERPVDFVSAYASLVAGKVYPDNKAWRSPMVEQWTTMFATQLSAHFGEQIGEDQTLRKKLAKQLLSTLKLSRVEEGDLKTFSEESDAEGVYSNRLFIETGEECWSVDLLTGEIFNASFGIVSKGGSYAPWEKDPAFQRLFGAGSSFFYTAIGEGCYAFEHPEMGNFRIIRRKGTTIIRRQFPKVSAQWFEYKDDFRGNNGGIPSILQNDHTLWVPVRNSIPNKGHARIVGYIATLKGQELRYAVDTNGKIVEVGPKKGSPKSNGRAVDYAVAPFSFTQSNFRQIFEFEGPQNILVYRDRKTDKVESLMFPRYTSQTGNPLTFVKRDGKMVWSENQTYFIPEKIPLGYLGDCSNFLFLKNEDERVASKLIVPFQEIDREGKISIHNTRPMRFDGEEAHSTEQWGAFPYFVFDVANGELKGKSLEARLYLAYFHLSQKKYAEAVHLFSQIKPTESLSPLSMKVLKHIMNFNLREDHPDGKMVQLHALHLYMQQVDAVSKTEARCYFSPIDSLMERMARNYVESLQSLNNISVDCSLSLEQEMKLARSFVQDLKLESSFVEVLMGVPSPDIALITPDTDVSRINLSNRIQERLRYLKSNKEQKQGFAKRVSGRRCFPDSVSGRFRSEKTFSDYILFPILIFPKKAYFTDQEEKYLEAVEQYQNSLVAETNWLSSDQPLPYSVAYPSMRQIEKNGTLFRFIYEMGREGTVSEKRAWLYRLKQWGIHRNSLMGSSFINLLIMLLTQPEKFPELIDVEAATAEEKYAFLQEIYRNLEDQVFRWNEELDSFFGVPQKSYPVSTFGIEGEYPEKAYSVFDQKEKTLEEVAQEPIPFNLNIEDSTARWETLQDWKKTFLNPLEQEEVEQKGFYFSFDESFLLPEEQEFKDAFFGDLEALSSDYEAGKRQVESKEWWSLSNENGALLLEKTGEVLPYVEQMVEEKQQEVLDTLNRWKAASLQEGTLVGGNVRRLATYDDCVIALLSMDGRVFKQWNPKLTDEEIDIIVGTVLQVEDLKSYQAQLSKIKEKCLEILEIEDQNGPVRCYACQELVAQLDARYYFDGVFGEEEIRFNKEAQLVLRVFVGETGMIPYKKQAKLISWMIELSETDPRRFKNIVAQLIMGGGKTALIAPIVLYLAATRNDTLSFFVLPDSLVETVKENCSESLKKAFKNDLLTFEIQSRKDLNLYKIGQIERTLNRAMERSEPLILKASNLHCIELELLSLSRKVKASVFRNSAVDRITKAKLQKLAEIWRLVSKKGDALMDEVDVLLNCLRETNYPDGDVIPIDGKENALIEKIYKTLLSEEIEVNGKSLVELVGLCTNEQAIMPKEVYIRDVIPVVAREIIRDFDPIKKMLKGALEESFIRYATGRIPAPLQKYADDPSLVLTENILDEECEGWREFYPTFFDIENDITFIRHLEKMFYSGSKEQRSAANLIGLTQHLLCDITPSTLAKDGKRDYGPRPNIEEINVTPYLSERDEKVEEKDLSLRVVPYLAVNVPATTEFGYYLEEACYYYQWLAAFSLEENDIKSIAKDYEASARYYIEKNGEKYEETAEYVFFKEFFGVPLDQIHLNKKLAIAMETIAADPLKRLELGYDIVAQKVERRSERLSSNGVNLVSQIGSARTMSGTPWNVSGYLKSLLDRYFADEGTEGKILHTLAKKTKREHLHEVNFETLSEFIEGVFSGHSDPNRIRGIIESGGLFKKFRDNAEVAKELMLALTDLQEDKVINDEIEGVLFFHKDEGQREPDTLYIWKRGASHPERIGGSTKEALKAKGLDPSKYFVYYDERHTTGVDILQMPYAINLFTFDEKMIVRNIGQGVMRLRQLLFFQQVEFVTTSKVREQMINGGETFQDWILTAQKNQSIKKTKDMVRHFKQQIDNVFRFPAVKAIVKASLKIEDEREYAETVALYEPFFVTNTIGENYLLHGRLKLDENTKKMLLKNLKEKWRHFSSVVTDEKILRKVKQEYKALKAHINETLALPTTWKNSKDQLGVEQEVEVEMLAEEEQNVNVDLTVEEEVLLELERYNELENLLVKPDEKWTEEAFCELIEECRNGAVPLISLKKELGSFDYGFGGERHFFENCFQQSIYGTESFFYPYTKTLPVFHRAQKPAKQLLCIETDGGMVWILASEFEASAFRKHLKALSEKSPELVEGVWLVQPDTSSFLKRERPFPLHLKSVQDGLLEVNAFLGNVKYINKCPVEFEEWMLEGEKELKKHFLKLRAASDPEQNRLLRSNPQIQEIDGDFFRDSSTERMLRARLEKEAARKGNTYLKPVEVKRIGSLKNVNINDLNVTLVPYLGIDWDLQNEDPLTKEAIGDLTREDVEELNTRVFSRLARFQVQNLMPEQMRWLPVDRVLWIKMPEQIYRVEGEQPVYYLKEEHVSGLKESQAHLIPFVNPEFYCLFDQPWQVEAVPVEHVDKVNPDLWVYLSKEQIKALRNDIAEHLQPDQYRWVHGSCLEQIPAENRDRVIEEQIQEITDPSLIKRLEALASESFKGIEEGVWSSYICDQMVPSIDFDEQLRYLNKPSQIRAVPNEQVENLKPVQVRYVKGSQVPFLVTEAQIQEVPLNLVYKLTAGQVPAIAEHQVPALREEEQVQALPLDAPHLFAQLTANQMVWISDAQLELIQEEQVKGLDHRQLLTLAEMYPEKWEIIRFGLTQEQVNSFKTGELIDLLSVGQIRAFLQEEQVHLLHTEEQVQACPDLFAVELKGRQLQYAAPRQLEFLSNEKLVIVKSLKTEEEWIPLQEAITLERMRAFDAKDLVDLLSQEQKCTHLLPRHVPFFENADLLRMRGRREYLNEIVADQVKRFDSQELIDLLNPQQIRGYLQEYQVPFLKTKAQVEACPDRLVALLDDDQLALIAPRQVPFLRQEALFVLRELKEDPEWDAYQQRIPQEWIETFYDQGYINLLNGEQIHEYLQPGQVQFLETEAQVQACPDHLLGELSIDRQITKVSQAQLRKLEDPEQVRAISFWKVKHLTREQLRKRSWTQFLTYTVGVLTLGVAASVVSLIACLTIVPIVYVVNRETGRLWLEKVKDHPHRLYRFFEEYISPQVQVI